MIAEIILLEDQSQPLPSQSPLDGVTDTSKIFHAAGDDREALQQAGLSVTDVQHFTEKYKPGFSGRLTQAPHWGGGCHPP